MNKKEYMVTCSKCNSTNIKYDYRNTTINSKNNKVNIPLECLNCGYETVEEK